KIRRITPRAEEMFYIIPSDTGRPLHHFSSRFDYEGLGRDIRKVLENLNTVERQVRTNDGEWYFMRINPYRTTENYVDGVVMSFFEITDQKRKSEKLEEYSRRIETALQFTEHIIELVGDPFVVLDRDLKISRASGGFVQLFGLGNRTIAGWKICEIDERFEFLEERLPELEDAEENFSIPFSKQGNTEWEGTVLVRILNLKEPNVTKLLLIFQKNGR
ncbi:MAG: PAS domain-containing protein, partial [Spirochaetota bacterium]